MSTTQPPQRKADIVYPESDGKPMADNSRQMRWIVKLYYGLAGLFGAAADVFVCGNQFWYPREGHPEIVNTPDVYAVFGRPKGDRPSWKQWEENDTPMTVVFEVRSPKNTDEEMAGKVLWYQEYGVEECYIYDPDADTLEAWTHTGPVLHRQHQADGWVSPRLGIRFDLSGDEMVVYRPNGRPFLTPEEIEVQLRAQQADHRVARLADLARKLLAGQISEAEKQELARLAAPPSA